MAGDGRTPNMMAGVKIILYITLVLTSETNVTSSQIQGRGPKKLPEVIRDARKASVSRSGNTEVKTEVDSKVRMSLQQVHTKQKLPHLVVDDKEMVSHLKHSKPWVSGLNIHDGQLRLDSYTTQLEEAGKMLSVKDCPSGCDCRLGYILDHQPALVVRDCQSDPVSSLPKLFYSHQDITVLFLNNCHLTTLPPEITKLPLILVSITMNEFTEVPQELTELPQLQYLYMDHNKLSSLPADVTKWSALIHLTLGYNLLREVPQDIGVMRGLVILNMTHNAIQSLPNSISALVQLDVFDVSNNNLSSVPQSIGSLLQLQALLMGSNNLSSVPQSIGSLSQLLRLDISNNNLHSLPESIGSLLHLRELHIDNNKLYSVPQSIGLLAHLVWLDIHDNDLSSVPQSIGSLSRLKSLDISNNYLSSVPQSIGSLLQLQALLIENNNLYSLPQSIGSLLRLVALLLDNNNLSTVPQSIGSLLQLKTLDLSDNNLSTVPQSIGSLAQLNWLDISQNNLPSIPHSIGSLLELKVLYANNNNLQSPPQVASLGHLEALFLRNNPLGVVPTLPKQDLMQFICSNCSIKMLPCTLFTEGHIGVLALDNNGLRNADCGDITNVWLTELDLSHNLLQKVPCEFIGKTLEVFEISYNNVSILSKNCILLTGQFLRAINFDHNKIEILHFNSFCAEGRYERLNHISFGSNRIRIIDTSDSTLNKCFKPGAVIDLGSNMLSSLESWPMLLSQSKSIKLNVSNNYLSHFTSSSGRSFHPNQYGSVFTMQGNQIKHFMDIFNGWNIIVNTSQALNALFKNTYFDLGYNPLVCDCVDYEVYKYIQRLPFENYSSLVCQEPWSLRGQNPYNISLINFVCDIDTNCPDGCTCAKVPHSQTVDVTCLSYNETDIPEIVPDLPKQNYEYRIDICHQNLHGISPRPYLHKTTEILLSNNSIKMINSSDNFQSVKILLLNDNRLERLPESVSSLINNTDREIRLGGNPWICDCEALSMKKWLTKYWTFIKDMDDIQCGSPNSMKGKKVVDITEATVCPGENRTPAYFVAAISSAVFICLLILYFHDTSKIAHFRLIGRDECDGEGKEFDIFMCACSAVEDADYVEKYLIHELERRDFKVLYHKEHFHPGKPIHINMSEALEKSKRTLVFFSNSFRESNFGMFEFHSAYDMDCRNNTKRLITIKDRTLDMNKLETAEVEYFRKHTILDRDSRFFWKLLLSALPRKRLGGHVEVRHRGLIN